MQYTSTAARDLTKILAEEKNFSSEEF